MKVVLQPRARAYAKTRCTPGAQRKTGRKGMESRIKKEGSNLNRRFSLLLLVCLIGVSLYVSFSLAGAGQASGHRTWKLDPSTPILTGGAPGQFDARLEEADAYMSGSTYYVNYAAWDKEQGTVGSIGQASGPSLTRLTKKGQILKGTPGAWDSAYVSGPRTYCEASKYYLYYFGSSTVAFEGIPSSLGVAIASSPGGAFKKYKGNPILSPGPAGTWDGKQLFRPFLVKSGATYYLFYNANGSLGGEQIGFATGPGPVGPFTRYKGNPSFFPKRAWEASRVGDPMIYKDGSTWVMYYYGANDSIEYWGVGCATSGDLVTWTECPDNPLSFPKIGFGLIRPSLLSENNYGTMLLDGIPTNSLYVARR